MELQSIRINSYKSIKKPVDISLNSNNGVITFVGKNGSGKTNILQAIKDTLIKNYGYLDYKQIDSEYVLKITKEERKQYFSTIDIEPFNDTINVKFDGNEPTVKKVDVPVLKVCFIDYQREFKENLEKFKEAKEKYLEKLRSLEMSLSSSEFNYSVRVKENAGIFYVNAKRLKDIESIFDNQINSFEDFQNKYLTGKYIDVEETIDFPSCSLYGTECVKVFEDEEINLSPIVAASLGVDQKTIDEANIKLKDSTKKLNQKLKNEYDIIKQSIDKLNGIIKKINDVFNNQRNQYYINEENSYNKYKKFCIVIKESVFKSGYYIDNEETLLFYDGRRGYGRYKTEFLNHKNPIIEAFHNFLNDKHYYKEGESILEINKIKSDRLQLLIDKINKEFLQNLVSDFDKNEVLGYEAKFEQERIILYVKEKSGDLIDFNSTSLGRRWYLTYSFIKQIIKKGEVLLVDEPAAFLHPEAQIELRKDLESLAKKGVIVFITTHSPYMIPSNWENVYNVSISENGTDIKQFECKDKLCESIQQELGIVKTSDILFNLSKTILLVEGVTDEACIRKFAEVLDYNLSDYHIIPCYGSSIIGMIYLCVQEGVKFKALLDADNKSKPREYYYKHENHKEYIKIIKSNPNCVFTPDNGECKSLEDCFSKDDASKYFSQQQNDRGETKTKIDKKKIEKGKSFTEETMRKFDWILNKLGLPKTN